MKKLCKKVFSNQTQNRPINEVVPASLSLACRAFEIKLVMHPDPRRQQVVHDHQAHVFGIAAVAIKAEELW